MEKCFCFVNLEITFDRVVRYVMEGERWVRGKQELIDGAVMMLYERGITGFGIDLYSRNSLTTMSGQQCICVVDVLRICIMLSLNLCLGVREVKC